MKFRKTVAGIVSIALLASSMGVPFAETGVSLDFLRRGLIAYAEEAAGAVGTMADTAALAVPEDEGVTILDDFTFSTDEEKGTASVVSYTGSDKAVKVPSEIDGLTVTSIGNNAFADNTSIESVTIPTTVVSVGTGCFKNCVRLKKAVIPYSVEIIGASAFENCMNLVTVSLNEGLTTIGVNAFKGTAVSEIYIPTSLTSIKQEAGIGPFAQCENLKTVVYGEGIASIPAYLFSGCTGLSEIVVPEGVVSIGDCAFSGCSNVENILLPDSVEAIGKSSFSGLLKVTDIALSASLNTIGDSAFVNCTHLNSIAVPASVTSIGSSAFAYCVRLSEVTFNEGLVNLGSAAFKGTAVSSVYIPSTLTGISAIGEGPFSSCGSLSDIEFSADITSIPNAIFASCTGLKNVVIPQGVVSIGDNAFANCTNVTSVTLSDTLKTVGKGAFQNLTKVTSITIPDSVETISSSAFSGCSKIAEVEIPSTVKVISDNAFNGCSKLANVTLNEGLETLGYGVFSGTAISSIYIPSTLTAAGVLSLTGPFTNCGSLETVIFADGIEAIPDNLFINCSGLKEISVPSGIVTIGKNAFNTCSNVEKISIAKSVKAIGEGAFANLPLLKEAALPDTLETIGASAFKSDVLLESVDIPATVQTIGANAFSGCEALAEITLKEGLVSVGTDAFSGTAVSSIYIPSTLSEVGQKGIFENCESLSEIKYAEGITAIPANLFNNCPGIKEIVIPDTVVSIGDSAFSGCLNAVSLTLPAKLQTIGNSAFASLELVAEISIPDTVESIGAGAFSGCAAVKAISLPDKLTVIEDSAFQGMANLETLTIPEGITSIGKSAFSGCCIIQEVEIPASVESIGASAFEDCYVLSQVKLNEGLKSIGEKAFSKTKISSIIVPSTVETAGAGIFEDCEALRSAEVSKGMVILPDNMFRNCAYLETVKLPDSVTTLGDYAFAGCAALREIVSDSDDYKFGPHTFDGCMSLTDARAAVFDKTITAFDADMAKSSVGGIVNFTLKYALLEDIAEGSENYKINLNIPAGLSLVQSSVTSKDLDIDASSIQNGSIIVSAPQGTIKFTVRVAEVNSYVIAPSMSFTYGGNNWVQKIASLNLEVPKVTVAAADTTNEFKADVYGITYKGACVEIYVNNKLKTACISNEYTGKYKATVDLPKGKDGTSYEIYAICKNAQSEKVTTTYSESEPTINKIEMVYNNHNDARKDITDVFTMGSTPVISYNPAYPLQFIVHASNNDSIIGMYVTSTKGSVTKYLKTTYDEKEKAWMTNPNEYFDKNNRNYIPGSLNVRIVKRDLSTIDVSNGSSDFSFSILSEEAKAHSSVESIAENDNASIKRVSFTTDDNETASYDYFMSESNSKVIGNKRINVKQIIENPEKYGYRKSGNKVVDHGNTYTVLYKLCDSADTKMSVSTLNSSLAANFKESISYVVYCENSVSVSNLFNKIIYMSDEDDDDDEYDPYPVDGTVVDIAVDKTDEAVSNQVSSSIKGGFFSWIDSHFDTSVGGKTNTVIDAANNAKGFYDNYTDYQDRLDDAGDNENMQRLAEAKYHTDNLCDIGGMFSPFLEGVGYSTVKDGLNVIYGHYYDIFALDEEIDDLLNGTDGDGNGDGYSDDYYSDSGNMNMLVDPSGIVYDTVKGNRIQGAKVTVYKLNTETESEEPVWDVWNAEDYDQQNPLYTDEDGAYAWVVPEGRYKVTCEMEGYDTQTSEEFDVPPEKTDLNFSLVSNQAPEIKSVEKSDGSLIVTFTNSVNIDTVNADTLKLEGTDAKYTVTPMLYDENDKYTNSFLVKGNFKNLDSITVHASESIKNAAGISAKTNKVIPGVNPYAGDVNNDGKISGIDASLAFSEYKLVYGGNKGNFNEDEIKRADMNGDGKITAVDASKIFALYKASYKK